METENMDLKQCLQFQHYRLSKLLYPEEDDLSPTGGRILTDKLF